MATRRRTVLRALAPIVATLVTAGLIATGASFAGAVEPSGSSPTATATLEASADTAPGAPQATDAAAPPAASAHVTAPADSASATVGPAATVSTVSAGEAATVTSPASVGSPASAEPSVARLSAAATEPADGARLAETSAAASAVAEPASATFHWAEGEATAVAATAGTADVVTVTGTVTDGQTHAPISGFRVAAVDGDGGPEQEIGDATTADDGTFTLAAQAPHDYFRLLLRSNDAQFYVTASGWLNGVATGSAYAVGTLALTQGAALSGTVALPATTNGGRFPVSVSVQAPNGNYGDSAFDTADAGAHVAWRLVVPPGTYSIRFSDGRNFVEQWWKDAARREDATSLTVTAGQRVDGLDAALSFGQNSIAGTVTGADGRPLSGVSVQTYAGSNSYSATTGDDGRYYFGNLAPGTYKIAFYPKLGVGVDTYYGGASYDSAAPIVISGTTPTTRTGVDVTIVAGATVTGTLPAGALGKVTHVAVRPESGYASGSGSLAADGSFRIVDIPAGTYRLQLSGNGFNETWGDAFTLAAGDQRVVDVSGYTIELGTVAVTVDLPGEAAEGSGAYPGTIELLDAATRSVVTSAGAYSASVTLTARPGDYLVRYRSYRTQQVIYYGGGASPDKATVVTIEADKAVAITLSGGTGRIAGIVSDATTSAVIEGATVTLFRADNTGTPVTTTKTAADGTYAFGGLVENNYSVSVDDSANLRVPRWFGGSGKREDATPIVLGDGASYTTANVALTLGGGIAGTFADAASGSPSTYLSLYVYTSDSGNQVLYRSGSVSTILTDGRFELRGVPAGTYRISGSLGSASYSTTDPITVVAGSVTQDVALALPTAQILGKVTSAETGNPVYARVEATWTVHDQTFTWTSSTSTYSDSTTGAYRLSGIPAGASVTLSATPSSSSPTEDLATQWWQGAAAASAATPIVIGAAGSAPFVADMALTSGISVRGRFIDAVSGQPVAGVSYSIGDRGGRTSGSDGSFVAAVDGAGPAQLHTSANSSYVESSTTLTVPAEGLSSVDIPLQRGYAISGRVVAANNGVPLTNVNVRVTSADNEWSGSYSTYIYDDGVFTLPAREPGRYKIEINNYSGLYIPQWYNGAAGFRDATVIDVVDKSITDINMRMTLGGGVTGHIVDAHGQPLAGATVGVATAPERAARVTQRFSALAAPFTGTAASSPILGIETHTDANGDFVLPPLEPGDYALYVYTPATGTTWYNGKATRSEADVVHVTAGQRQPLAADLTVPDLPAGATPRTPEQTLSDAFAIVAGPASQATDEGQNVTFSALASGTPTPTVQWQRRGAGQNGWSDIPDATDVRLSFTAVPADNGASYRAVFTQGSTRLETDAAALTVNAAPTAPGTPAKPTVSDLTTTGATLTWAAPADGGRAISGYDIAIYAAGATTPLRTVRLGAVTTTTLGLEPGTAYEATVTAKNAIGAGAESARTAFTTVALTAPGAVTGVTAVADSATALTVTWQPPAADGGSPVTGYRVTATAGESTVVADAAASARSAGIAGLAPDTEYRVSVAAINAIGTGTAGQSTVRTKVLPPVAVVPGAPSGLRLVAATPTTLQIGWDAPASDGGSAVTGYTVAVAGGAQLTVEGDVRQAVVSALTPETAYTLTVTATNAVGIGATSEPLKAATAAVPVSAPGVPQQVTAVATSPTTASLSWQAPASDGGAPITDYDVTVTRSGAAVIVGVTVIGTTAVVTGLLPETGYGVTVAARNRVGAGEASASVSFTTLDVAPAATAPAQPQALRVVSLGADSATLAWDAPATDGGSPVTGYQLIVTGPAATPTVVPVDGLTHTVSGLAAGATYGFSVRAINVVGLSQASATLTVAIAATGGGTETGGGTVPVPGGGSIPAGGGTAPAAPAEGDLTSQNRGGIGVDANSVAPGAALTVSGLTPGARYSAWFFSTPVSAGTVTADASGTATVTVPATLQAGSHRLVLTDPATGAIVGWVPFTVTGLPATGISNPVGIVGLSALLLAVGGALVFGVRRRARA